MHRRCIRKWSLNLEDFLKKSNAGPVCVCVLTPDPLVRPHFINTSASAFRPKKKKKEKITSFHMCFSSDQLLKAKSHTLTAGLGLHFCKGRRNINRKGEGWRCWVLTRFWSTGLQRACFCCCFFFFFIERYPIFPRIAACRQRAITVKKIKVYSRQAGRRRRAGEKGEQGQNLSSHLLSPYWNYINPLMRRLNTHTHTHRNSEGV